MPSWLSFWAVHASFVFLFHSTCSFPSTTNSASLQCKEGRMNKVRKYPARHFISTPGLFLTSSAYFRSLDWFSQWYVKCMFYLRCDCEEPHCLTILSIVSGLFLLLCKCLSVKLVDWTPLPEVPKNSGPEPGWSRQGAQLKEALFLSFLQRAEPATLCECLLKFYTIGPWKIGNLGIFFLESQFP